MRGDMICRRLKASSWRVSTAARCPASRISRTWALTGFLSPSMERTSSL